MPHLHSLSDLKLHGSWVTIGAFDGVHRGHQALISDLVKSAHAANAPAVVVTFFPHPVVILRGLTEPFYLTSPQEKADHLFNLGVDYVITLPFDQTMATLSPDIFMQNLVDSLGLCCLWIGHDFALGKNRSGNQAVLTQLGEKLGYRVEVIPAVINSEGVISSSQIRAALKSGDVNLAAHYLGRPYDIRGTVITGDQRGRSIGLPTANLDIFSERLLPANGVYATWAWLGEKRYQAVTNIGVRPTFENQPVLPRLEAHLLDFNQNIYGQLMRIEFVSRLRGEQRFSSIEALLKQVQQDILNAREEFSHA